MKYPADITLELNSGATKPLLFKTQAVIEYSDIIGVDYHEVLNDLKTKKVPEMILAAYRTYHRLNHIAFDPVDINDVFDWIEEMEGGMNAPIMAEVLRTFMWRASGRSKEEFNKLFDVVPNETEQKEEKKSKVKKIA